MSHAQNLTVSFVLKNTDVVNAVSTNKNISRIITEPDVETILNNTIKSSSKVCIIKNTLEPRSLIFIGYRWYVYISEKKLAIDIRIV